MYRADPEIEKFLKENGLTSVNMITIPRPNWDCDNDWYLCKSKEDKKVLVATNHGSPYIADTGELQDEYNYYKMLVNDIQQLLHAI